MSEFSARHLLVPYLFTRRRPEGGVTWYGVSAYSLEDAVALLRAYGYVIDPADAAVEIREGAALSDFERRHIAPNMGPTQLRGVWFPQHNLGDAAATLGRDRDPVT